MDRVGLAPDVIEAMKTEMIQVVSRYLVVDEEALELSVERSGDRVVLVSNIPVRELVRAAVIE
jgi:cell division topological specificity factor